MLLQDKVVVVCGLGPGLGRAIALQSARAGADVVLAARSTTWMDEVAAEVKALGRQAVTAVTDVTDDELAEHLPQTALEAFGRVDALVNNAFAIPPITGLADVDLDAVRAGFETNVIGALRMTRLFTPALAAGQGVGRDDQLRGAAALPAHVRAVQDGQGGIAGPGREPGHRARAAGHPGQLGGPRIHLGRLAEVVFRPAR